MILPINSERTEIFSQIKNIEKMRTRLSPHTPLLKEFNHVRVLFKFIENHLNELLNAEQECQESSKAADLALYLEANTRIKNHITLKMHQVKQLLKDHRYQAYASHALHCLAAIIRSLSAIEWKLLVGSGSAKDETLNQTSEIAVGETAH